MKIFVTGHCSLHWGRLENGNIGNYYITETTFRELHRVFPGAEIVTTFQMTEGFCQRENVQCVPMELYYGWNETDLPNALRELGIALLYKTTGAIVDTTLYISEVMGSDLVVDFSGEMWGYHADLVGKDRFLVGLIKNRVSQLLGRPTVMMAGSQGRFPDPQIKKFAKEVFEGFDYVANREAETGKLLVNDGFDLSNLENFACPAFLFEPASQEEMKEIYEKEQLNIAGRKTVGFILCGFNMLEEPFDKWPRDDQEYTQFAEVIEHLVNVCGTRVVLLSHSNGFELPPKFKLIPGRDYPIVKQLHDVVEKRGKVNTNDVSCLKGPYNPWQTKAIIGTFDMLVTGRLHASVAGTSQCVPTVVIMHGHKQKSHKTIGFFDILGLPEYVAYPLADGNMIEKTNDCWENRSKIRAHLEARIPEVKQLSRDSFDALKDIIKK